MAKLTQGQKLWWVPVRYASFDIPMVVTVTKVGRIWAELNIRERISVENLVADGKPNRSSSGRCYLSKEIHDAELEISEAWNDLRNKIKHHNVPAGVTVIDIEAAKKLLRL